MCCAHHIVRRCRGSHRRDPVSDPVVSNSGATVFSILFRVIVHLPFGSADARLTRPDSYIERVYLEQSQMSKKNSIRLSSGTCLWRDSLRRVILTRYVASELSTNYTSFAAITDAELAKSMRAFCSRCALRLGHTCRCLPCPAGLAAVPSGAMPALIRALRQFNARLFSSDCPRSRSRRAYGVRASGNVCVCVVVCWTCWMWHQASKWLEGNTEADYRRYHEELFDVSTQANTAVRSP